VRANISLFNKGRDMKSSGLDGPPAPLIFSRAFTLARTADRLAAAD
jgi:hypothetical protein